MSGARGAVMHFEVSKLARATVTRVATAASLTLTLVTTVGGYAATQHGSATEMGRKAASMMTAPGWDGYIGLAATSVGVVCILVVGIVMAWTVGREFTEGTVVGLFGLPVSTGEVGVAKMVAAAGWAMLVAAVIAVLTAAGGVFVGLPAHGALRCAVTLFAVGALLGLSALPIMWIATITQGYLGGIAATLTVVAVTNIAAGLGVGRFIPWAVPTLWAAPGTAVQAPLLALPLISAALGVVLTKHAWRSLQLGNR